MARRTIRAQTIMTLLKQVVDPSDNRTVVWDAPIRGGAAVVRALYRKLNNSREFSGYGLSLTPGDLANASSLGDVGGVIISWFQRNNYTVII
jgi:hypothetical protein